MDPTGIDPKTLKRTQDIVKGRGFLGWLTHLFMGKSFRADLSRAGQALDQIELQQHLATKGKTARGVVQEIRDTGSLINFNPVVLLSIKVQPESGPEFRASFTTTVSKLAIPRVGDTVAVVYDPQDHSRIALAS